MVTELKTPARIMLVDDTPANLRILMDMLSDQGYEIQSFTKGRMAIEAAKLFPPDLVLLDINMPEMNGYEVCERLKADVQLAHIPVIFLSALNETQDKVMGFQKGGVDYITKPFQFEEVAVRIQTHLELKQSREKLQQVNEWLETQVAIKTAELKKANEELLTLDAAKNAFLKLLSHEIRTPLNGIVGPVQLLRMAEGNEEISEYLEMLEQSVARLEKFSYKALLITQLKAKKYPFRPEAINVLELIRKQVSSLQEILTKKRIHIELEVPPGFEIRGDQNLVSKALEYALDNAVRYSPEGRKITVACFGQNHDNVCEVIDEGPGFTAEALPTIFQPFSMAEEHIDKNIGLSLYLVKLFMELHRGSIEVANISHKGATVRFRFPV